MSEFEVKVVKIDDVVDHPDADRLTVVKIGGFNCIANKKEDGSWRYQGGDMVVYIPEGAVVPDWLLKHMGFWNDEKDTGGLAGSKGNRVKAMKLRGIFSQGILLPVEPDSTEDNVLVISEPHNGNEGAGLWRLGDNVAEGLGITKHEPVIPSSMNGEMFDAFGKTLKFDVENIQKYPDIFVEGEAVNVTEKLHGTWTCFGAYPEEDGTWTKIVTSKGMSAKGLAFKLTEENAGNLYVRMLNETKDENGFDIIDRLIEKMNRIYERSDRERKPFYLLGETYGKGVQDLAYGEDKPTFRAFDLYSGQPGQGEYVNSFVRIDILSTQGIESVPMLYEGPFSMEKMEELRDGRDYSNSNIREGIVIRPHVERQNDFIGRVMLKYVSPKYLLRKGDTTEFN